MRKYELVWDNVDRIVVFFWFPVLHSRFKTPTARKWKRREWMNLFETLGYCRDQQGNLCIIYWDFHLMLLDGWWYASAISRSLHGYCREYFYSIVYVKGTVCVCVCVINFLQPSQWMVLWSRWKGIQTIVFLHKLIWWYPLPHFSRSKIAQYL